MTGAEYRERRETDLKMTRAELGRMLGLDKNTIYYRERAPEVKKEAELAIEALLERRKRRSQSDDSPVLVI